MHQVELLLEVEYSGELERLTEAARTALQMADAPAGDLSIVLTAERRMQELNARFLGSKTSTDVLAFPDGEPSIDTGRRYHGDVILCLPVAERQAEAHGNQLIDELSLLTVHGVLHLLGYDHNQPEDKEVMWEIQERILHSAGIEMRPFG
jgi:probable rRNA maturation factor